MVGHFPGQGMPVGEEQAFWGEQKFCLDLGRNMLIMLMVRKE